MREALKHSNHVYQWALGAALSKQHYLAAADRLDLGGIARHFSKSAKDVQKGSHLRKRGRCKTVNDQSTEDLGASRAECDEGTTTPRRNDRKQRNGVYPCLLRQISVARKKQKNRLL